MTAAPDITRLREELLEQQRQALDAALRERADHPQPSVCLDGGTVALLAALEAAMQAIERQQREGGR